MVAAGCGGPEHYRYCGPLGSGEGIGMGKALHLKKDWPPLCQDWDSPAFKGLHAGGKIGNALQAAQIPWLHMVAMRIDVLDLFLKAICFCKRNSDVFASKVRQDCI